MEKNTDVLRRVSYGDVESTECFFSGPHMKGPFFKLAIGSSGAYAVHLETGSRVHTYDPDKSVLVVDVGWNSDTQDEVEAENLNDGDTFLYDGELGIVARPANLVSKEFYSLEDGTYFDSDELDEVTQVATSWHLNA